MKKDIEFHTLDEVIVTVAKELTAELEIVWNVYFINRSEETLENVLVTSEGYGVIDGENRKTSVLRHNLGTIKAGKYQLIEAITEQVFVLNNEYWASFYIGNKIYDKRFIFKENTIIEENLVRIPELGMLGKLVD